MTAKTMTASEARELLLRKETENAEFLESIDWNTRAKVDMKFYTVDGALIITDTFREKEFTTIIPVCDTMDLTSVCTWAAENRGNSHISISVGGWSEADKASAKELLAETHTFDRTAKNYRYTREGTPSIDRHIRPLTTEDKEAFLRMEFVKETNRPSQEILFDHYLVSKYDEGTILGYFEDGDLLGYLPYFRVSGDNFENDYIWVAPSKRNQGIGGKLTDAFVAAVLESRGVPLWSDPKTDISAHLAETHGFTPLNEIMRFTAK